MFIINYDSFILEKKRRGKFALWRYYTKITDFVRSKFKLVIMKPLLLSIGYLMFIPIVHGISNLEVKYVAEVLEKFVSVIGIILIVPLCSSELNTKILKNRLWKVFPMENNSNKNIYGHCNTLFPD